MNLDEPREKNTQYFYSNGISTKSIKYDETSLTPGEVHFLTGRVWHPTIDEWNPLYRDIHEPFNLHKFTCPRLPVDMGLVSKPFRDYFAHLCPRVLRVPIKVAGSSEIRIPKELKSITPWLLDVLQYEHFINPNLVKDFFVHLTVDHSLVKAGNTHRYGGFHGDGLQGGKFKVKQVVEHSYVYTDINPTLVALQPFFVAHLNECRVNIFKEFDRQLKSDSLYRLRAGHLYLIDPYVVHASPKMEEDTERTFVRLTVAPSELLSPHNTKNPMFDGQEYPEILEVRDFVAEPDMQIPLDYYGLESV